jgi:hypothetical protein
MVSPDLENIQHAPFNFNFDYERKVVTECEKEQQGISQNPRTSSERGASAIQVCA